MEEIINQLKRNTNFLYSKIKEQNSLLNKIEVVEQIYMNLKVLKEEMMPEDYEKDFKDLESKIDKLLDQLTDKKLIDDLLSNLKNLLGLDI